MYRNYITRILIIVLPVAIAIGAGYWSIKETRSMAYAEKKTDVRHTIPPIDQKAPAQMETATFALG